MNLSPVFLGTCLACALGGAIAGTSLGSTPVLARADTDTMQPSGSPAIDQSVAVSQSTQLSPDHYPLVTPRGTVAVVDLSERGLYSQTRYRDSDAYVATALAAGQIDAGNHQQPVMARAVNQVAPKTSSSSLATNASTRSLNLAQGPGQINDPAATPARAGAKSESAIGHARIINVSDAIQQNRKQLEPVNLANR
ncbi:hypothetical protein GRI58_13205 [Porphyrobacter algicida]|uniref:Uncharacterized protein n=1 Tax=Qipengyuania algicida TaxID=1836209 RepID=A0A845AMM5_9SPHN|nr:hypothetical protein [Qipengyuania algicida]MXP29766.1 hypothetical protein [Qipengyuania algicida]